LFIWYDLYKGTSICQSKRFTYWIFRGNDWIFNTIQPLLTRMATIWIFLFLISIALV
jgi:hypothetical protein